MRLGQESLFGKRRIFVASNVEPGEGCTRFGGRVLAERYNAYYQHFKDYPLFFMDQKQFSRVAKILDSKFGTWRNKADKQAYLTRFSPSNWAEGKIITKEGKRNHSLSNCTTCQKFNWAYQGTLPYSKDVQKPQIWATQ